MLMPIALKTRYQAAVYSRAFYWHWRQSISSYFFLVAGVAFVALAMLQYALPEPSHFWKIYGFCFGGLILARPVLRKRYFLSQLRKSPIHGKEICFTIAESGITTKTEVSEGTLKWSALHLTITTPDGFLLYPQKNLFSWLPNGDFGSEEEVAEFAELLSVQTKNRVLGKKKQRTASAR